MQFTDTELAELKWALHVANDRLRRVVEAMREEKGLLPSQELADKLDALDGLLERFGPIDQEVDGNIRC